MEGASLGATEPLDVALAPHRSALQGASCGSDLLNLPVLEPGERKIEAASAAQRPGAPQCCRDSIAAMANYHDASLFVRAGWVPPNRQWHAS